FVPAVRCLPLTVPSTPSSPLFPYTTLFRSYFPGKYVGADSSSGVSLPDFVKLAEAYGLATERIPNHEGMDKKIQRVLDYPGPIRSEEHTSELQSPDHLVCRLLLEQKQ